MSNVDDEGYFNSYSYSGIHEEMIKDKVRTNTYKRAILNNRELFRDKIVLDVGCGTGILSMFAAQAGARHVFAVDKSEIAIQAREIIILNNFERVITVINSTIEEAVLPVEHVDIIISEWMGYCLLYESMLDSVIFARDKWLSRDGLIFPDTTSLYACAIEDEDLKEERVDWWSSVYGFNMTPMKKITLSEPLVDYVPENLVISNSTKIKTIDIYRVNVQDLKCIKQVFDLKISRSDIIHAFVFYFTVEFNSSYKPLSFSTSPFNSNTHWKQTIFYLREPQVVKKNQIVSCDLTIEQNKGHKRYLDIFIGVKDSTAKETYATSFRYSLK